jgi:apolipoprotein N-acyltransferase
MVLQIASHFGHYGVGFMMMLTSAWLVDFLQSRKVDPAEGTHWSTSSLNSIIRISIFAWIILSYATWTARQNHLRQLEPIKPLGRFVLIQDHMPTMFDATQELIEQGWLAYLNTTQKAIESIREESQTSSKPLGDPVDLIVWPESVYAELSPMMFWDRGDRIPSELSIDRQGLEDGFDRLDRNQAFKKRRLQQALGGTVPEMLVGTDVIDISDGKMNRYNSAVWIGHSGDDYYAKNHLVMFGEYIPILSWFPSIMQRIGLGTLSPGDQPKAWKLPSGRHVMTNVCFEDTVPHLMRRQVNELTKRGMVPDVMINISNDGWFRGSSILDHHLNSAILIAVENRIPVLIASNTGITAWIDGDGQVVERLPKMDSGWILAQPVPDGRTGYWSYWGDWPAILVALIGLLTVLKPAMAKIQIGKKRLGSS